jgi:hypothetical protein
MDVGNKNFILRYYLRLVSSFYHFKNDITFKITNHII